MKKNLFTLFALCFLCLLSAFSFAQTNRYWSGGGASGDFIDTANWANGIPIPGDNLYFDNTNYPVGNHALFLTNVYTNGPLDSFYYTFNNIITYGTTIDSLGARGQGIHGINIYAKKFENFSDPYLFQLYNNYEIGNISGYDLEINPTGGPILIKGESWDYKSGTPFPWVLSTLSMDCSSSSPTLKVSGSNTLTIFSSIYERHSAPGDVTNSASLQLVSGTPTVILKGQNTYRGLTTVGVGTLQLADSAGNTIPATNDVTVSNSATLQISFNQTLNNLTLASGSTLNVDNGVTLTINGTFNQNGGAINLNSSGAIVYGPTATLAYNGSTAQVTGAELTATVPNLTINNANSVTLNSGVTISSALSITSGTLTTGANNLSLGSSGSAIIAPTGILSITGGTTNFNGKAVTIQSSAAGTGSIGTIAGTLSNATNVTMQQYIPGGSRHYRLLSHPFSSTQPLSIITGSIDITGSGGSTNGFTTTGTNNPSAFYFNTATADGGSPNDAGWAPFTSASTASWAVDQGIRVLVRGTAGQGLDGNPYTPSAVTLSMAGGTVNTGSHSINLVTGGSGATAGFNLVGNPYPSPLDIGTVIFANSNVTHTVYVRNPQTSAYTPVSISGAYVIPANTSYFIQANSTTSLNFTEANKSICTSCATVFGVSSRLNNSIQFKVTDDAGLQWDNSYLVFNDNNNSLYKRGTDAVKLNNDIFNFYSISSDKQSLSVDYRKLDGQPIPLGLSIAAGAGTKNYTITASDYSVSNSIYDLYLYDKLTNASTKLGAGASYTITVNSVDSTTFGNNRLQITARANTSTLVPVTDKFSVTIGGNPVTDHIIVDYAAPIAGTTNIRLMNSNGQSLLTKSLGVQQKGRVSIPVAQFTAGIFLVEVHIGNDTVIKKVMKN